MPGVFVLEIKIDMRDRLRLKQSDNAYKAVLHGCRPPVGGIKRLDICNENRILYS